MAAVVAADDVAERGAELVGGGDEAIGAERAGDRKVGRQASLTARTAHRLSAHPGHDIP